MKKSTIGDIGLAAMLGVMTITNGINLAVGRKDQKAKKLREKNDRILGTLSKEAQEYLIGKLTDEVNKNDKINQEEVLSSLISKYLQRGGPWD